MYQARTLLASARPSDFAQPTSSARRTGVPRCGVTVRDHFSHAGILGMSLPRRRRPGPRPPDRRSPKLRHTDATSTMTYNFSAGPAVLPTPVLMQAQEELPDWHGTGMSVMEMSHRGSHFIEIAESAEARLRELMAVPDDYRVLFLQGGATGQFAAVPMNLSAQDSAADYVINGMWGKRAHAEASKYLDRLNVAAAASPSTYVPPQQDWLLTPGADYIHITLNETIQGVRFEHVPDTGSTPLVADVSSIILSEPIDVSAFGVLYASAQKNIGPSGLVVVMV